MRASFLALLAGALAISALSGCTQDLYDPDAGIWSRDLTGVVLDANGLPVPDASVSAIYTLAGPTETPGRGNGAKPRMGVSFSVPGEGALIKVQVFDFARMHVRTLEERHYEAGVYTVAWDGTDEKGLVAPNGVYHLRVEQLVEEEDGRQEYSVFETKILVEEIDLDVLVTRPNAMTDSQGRFHIPRDLIPVDELIVRGDPPSERHVSRFVTIQAAVQVNGEINRSIRDIVIDLDDEFLAPVEFSLP